jgi:hypothetical protein
MNRSLLLSARFRFSPEVQTIRDAAIDRITEQVLFYCDDPRGFTEREILEQEQLGGIGLPPITVTQSVARLVCAHRVEPTRGTFEDSYQLSTEARNQLEQIERETEERFQRVAARLFKHSHVDAKEYGPFFLDCLCAIFGRLGEAYVRVLKGESRMADLVGPMTIDSVVADAGRSYPRLDCEIARTGLTDFFLEEHPDYASIKWNLAQNYYVAKAIGLDASGTLLSKAVLAEAEFYLDTNIIIPALESRARHHQSVKALFAASALGRSDPFPLGKSDPPRLFTGHSSPLNSSACISRP